eukprot:Skav220954  [mRNA]  locus=scaffold1928:66565:67231:+ [translate_table: standard]
MAHIWAPLNEVLELVVEFFVSAINQELDSSCRWVNHDEPSAEGEAKPAFFRKEMNASNLRVMRFVRLARTLRGVRVIRLLRYIGSLRTIAAWQKQRTPGQRDVESVS